MTSKISSSSYFKFPSISSPLYTYILNHLDEENTMLVNICSTLIGSKVIGKKESFWSWTTWLWCLNYCNELKSDGKNRRPGSRIFRFCNGFLPTSTLPEIMGGFRKAGSYFFKVNLC